MIRTRLIMLIVFFPMGLLAQPGGESTFQFLNMVSSARIAALGGNQIAVKDNDINLGYYNPSLLNQEMDGMLSMNYINYFAGINYGFAGYAYHHEKLNTTFLGGIQYVNYGKFDEYDAAGREIGEFSAGEYVINAGAGHQVDSLWSVGANLKLIYSNLAYYNAFGACFDASATYHNPGNGITFAALVRNVGYQFKSYVQQNRERLPFDMQIGISKKLENAPFRLSLIGTNMTVWDLSYFQGESTFDPFTQTIVEPEPPGLADNLMRHFIFNGEILLTNNFHIQLGYNYRRRQELKVVERPGMVGFSWGFMVKVKKFQLSYGRAAYSLAGASNHITVSIKPSEFNRKN
jgi:hypothetical protein